MIAVSPEHVSRWLSCSLHCVILSVYYSEEIWRCAFPTYFPNNCQVLEFCLLMSSIEHNLRFFSHKGPNPSEPYLCQALRKDINCKINNGALTPEDINSPIPDYLTSLSLLHALHMEHNVMPNIDPKDENRKTWSQNVLAKSLDKSFEDIEKVLKDSKTVDEFTETV